MIAGDVSMPDQRAILCWANGQERLVIETRFAGEGTNFAWVVPLPAVPRVEAASTGVFRTLEHLTRPELRHQVAPVWRFILVLGAAAWLFATVRPTGQLEVGDAVAAAMVVVGLGAGNWTHVMWALMPALILLVVLALFRRGWWHAGVNVILIALFLGLALGFFSSGVSKASAEVSSAVNSIEVVSRQPAGVYDVEVISAHDAQALPSWLRDHGYALTPGSEPILEQYAREGWVFAAAKVRRDVAMDADTPHPLSFTFPAPAPLYPLRLTGSSREPLEVELYVFGDERATAPGFSVEECRRLWFEPHPGGARSWPWLALMRHPLLADWTTNCSVLTRLRGRLSPSLLEQDATIRWRPVVETHRVAYSKGGAHTMALNWGVSVAVCGLIVVRLNRGRWQSRRAWQGMAGGAVVLGILTGGVILGSLEVVEVRIVKNLHSSSRQVQLQAWAEASGLLDGQPEMALPQLREALRRIVSSGYTNQWASSGAQITTFTNPFTGVLMIEEDSPGNYVLRERTGRVEFVAYDAEGGELVMELEEPAMK